MPRGAADEVLEVVVIDTKVDDDVPDVVEELVDPVGFGPTLYNSSWLPAPQYCRGLPGHVKPQPPVGTITDPTPRVFPQKHSPPYSTPK